MTITINGIEHELIFQEMLKVHREVEREYLKEDIISKAYDMDIYVPTEELDKVAERVNKTLENNDSYWESYWMSIEYVLKEAAKEA